MPISCNAWRYCVFHCGSNRITSFFAAPFPSQRIVWLRPDTRPLYGNRNRKYAFSHKLSKLWYVVSLQTTVTCSANAESCISAAKQNPYASIRDSAATWHIFSFTFLRKASSCSSLPIWNIAWLSGGFVLCTNCSHACATESISIASFSR